MSTEFIQKNFDVVFNEQLNLVEIRYQGVNADLLATLAGRVDLLEAELATAMNGANGSLGTLSTSLNSLSTLVTVLGNNVSLEAAQRLAGDELSTTELLAAQQDLIDAIVAETNARGAAILAEAAARGAAIASATGTIITDVAALATTVSGLATNLGAAQASIITVQDALSTETLARAAQYSALLADFGDTNAAVLSESVARASDISALAAQLSVISAATGTTVFTQPDEPLSGMVSGDIWYDTDDGNKPYRYSGSAWLDVTDIRIINNAAAITSLALAVVDGDEINADLIDVVSASLTTETGNRQAADTALAGDIATVSGSVTTEASARIAADGVISAKYGVKVNANGHVAGFGLIATNNLYGNAGDSEFVIDATRVKVFNGTDALPPFTVVGGVVHMTNVVIDDAVIGSLTMSKVTDGTINAALTGGASGVIKFGQTAFDVGTGYWLGSVGGVTKMSLGGVTKAFLWDGTNLSLRGADITLVGTSGFTRYLGTDVASTYIDWYGASAGPVNDTNAKYFVKKDGSCMFGGRIRGEFEPKAWASISGEGTPTVRDCFNVASVSKYGTGRYRIYFHTPLPNTNYSCVPGGSDTTKIVILTVAAQALDHVDIETNRRGDGNFIDVGLLNFLIFGSNIPQASGGTNVGATGPVYFGGTYGGGPIP